MGVTLDAGTGAFTSGQKCVTMLPRCYPQKPRLSPVIYSHNAAQDATEVYGNSLYPAMAPILKALNDAGYAVFAITQPAASFGNGAASPSAGNATGQGRLHDALTAAVALGYTGKPVVMGDSEGSTNSLRYAALNPTNVACVVTMLTVCDLTDSYTLDWNSTRAGIGTAYGVTYPTPLPANTDPNLMTAALSGIPGLLHHSSDDTYSTGLGSNNPIATFCAATGMTEVNVGALGHTNASIAASSIPSVVAFIEAHAA